MNDTQIMSAARDAGLTTLPEGQTDEKIMNFVKTVAASDRTMIEQLAGYLAKVSKHLDIDPEEAQKHPGDVGDVLIEAIHQKNVEIERLEAEVERLSAMQ